MLPRLFRVHQALLFMGFLGLLSLPASATEWARFRGPNGTGVSETADIPAEWSQSDFNWSVELPGIGHSSPVVWKDKIFLLSADPDTATRHVLCMAVADGRILWQRSFPSTPHHLHTRSSYASCTPAVDADHVYVAWAAPEKVTLMALDHEGNTVWERDLGTWISQHGFGTSPIVFEDLVIMFNSQQGKQLKEGEKPGKSYMMAFERKTGKERWRTERASVNACYSIPFIYQEDSDQPQLVCTSTADGVFSLDPRTGKELWAVDAFTMRTVSSPVEAGGLIFGSTGSGGGGNYVAAIRPGENGEVVYTIERQAPYVPSTVAKGDLLFLFSDKGFASCIDAPTGKVLWQERLNTAFSGSPVRVKDKLFCIDEEGVVFVLAADDEFKVLARNPLGEPSRATPAVAGGRMYLRTYSRLFSVGGKST